MIMMNIQEIVEQYDALRKRCYDIMKSDPKKILGSDVWLQWVIYETDLQLEVTETTVQCWGSVFTSQTQSTESFQFDIFLSDLEA